jgi:hypothetical protein
MFHWQRKLLVAATISGIAWPVPAQLTCQDRCRIPAETGIPRVVIDANTGKVLSGGDRFPGDTQIEVVLANKNPFKYSYKFSVEEQDIELDLIGKVLQQLAILTADGQLPAPAPAAGPPLPGNVPVACPPGDAAKIAAAAVEATNAETANNLAIQRINLLRSDGTAFNLFQASVQTDPSGDNAEITCQTRCTAAANLLPGLQRLSDGKALTDLLSSLDAALMVFGNKVAGLKADGTLMANATCGQQVTQLDKRLTDAQASRQNIRGDVALLPDITKKAAAAAELLAAIAADPRAFADLRYLPARPEATRFKISVTRKDRESGADSTVSASVQAGRSRISVSAGIAVGFVGSRDYKRQSALVPDGQGGEKVGNTFAVDHSNETFGTAIQLNATIGSLGRHIDWGWSLGMTNQDGAADSDLGYYTGPSVATVGGNLIFTAGFYQQSIDSLGGGFELGDPVPDGLNDPLPTTTEKKHGFLFSVTYRFR